MNKLLRLIFLIIFNISTVMAMDLKSTKQNPFVSIKLCNDIQKIIIAYLPNKWFPAYDLNSRYSKYTTISMHPNHSTLAIGSNGMVFLEDLEDNSNQQTLKTLDKTKALLDHSDVLMISFSKDGKYLAASSQSKLLHIWDLLNGRYIKQLEGSSSPVTKLLSFTKDNKYIFSIDHNGEAKKWKIASGKCKKTFYYRHISSANLSLDDQSIISSGFLGTQIHNIETGKRVGEEFSTGLNYKLNGLQKMLVFSDFLFAISEIGCIGIWDLKDNNRLLRIIGNIAKYRENFDFLDLAISKDQKYLASPVGAYHKGIKIFDLDRGGEIIQTKIMRNSPKLILFNQNGSYLILLFENGNIEIWQNLEVALNDFHNKYVYDSDIRRHMFLKREKEQELCVAIGEKDFKRSKKLIDENVNVNARNEQYAQAGDTPLINALHYNDTDSFSEIIINSKTFDVNATNGEKRTPLMYAMWLGKLNILRKLIEFPNLNINAQDVQGFTALMFPIRNQGVRVNFKQCIDLLLSLPNIDVNIKNNDGYSALDIALKTGQTDVYNILLPYSNKSKDYLIRTLIKAKVDIDISENNILSAVLKSNSIDVIKLLENKKAQ